MCFVNYINCLNLVYALYKLFYYKSEKNIENVKKTAELCGPIGQKLLQFIVMHDGFLSPDTKDKLSYIFENCTTHSWKETEMTYLAEFGKHIEEDFDINYRDIIPVGSGTIGQVYKLYNFELNKYVALKVRHYNVESEARQFVKTITRILDFINKFTFLPFTILIHEFLENIFMQLDYTTEAWNTTLLKKNNIRNPQIIIPSIYFFSESVICMTYHDGVPFTQLDDTLLKNKISHDIFMFNMSSILIYDLIHCDLHYGNWKINITENGDYNIVIYDCGIMGSTFNDDINKQICIACMNGDYNTIYSILVKDMDTQENCSLMKEYTEYIMNKDYVSRSERFSDFLKQLFIYKININRRYLRCIQGLMTCMSLLILSSEKLNRLLGKEGNCLEVFLCYYSGLLEKTKKYPELLDYLNVWIEKDKTIETKFYDWLEEHFGHRDKSVFIDAILIKLLED